MTKINKEALSLDFDGVVLFRPPFQTNAVRDFIRHGKTIYCPPLGIPVIPDEQRKKIREEPVTKLRERAELTFARTHIVIPGVREQLSILNGTGVDIYGNTGRPNKRQWIDLTNEILQRGGVSDKFKDIFFRPKGVTSMESKLAAVADLRDKYGKVTHFDDNPKDALPIAAKFPDVQVIIVQDLSTGLLLSRTELSQYPNVRRVAVFKHAFNQL